jgi:heme exporter protein A
MARDRNFTEGSISCVELLRVGRVFGGTVALRGVNARFEKGNLHLIVGANGSGKTTLLRIVSTMLQPSFGQVTYEGVSPSDVRSNLGLVSHDALVYPDLTGEENLRLAAGLHGVDEEASLQTARLRFGLGAFARRPVRTMSRGQRQRVALARGLMHNPTLVLLDEPSTGLDADGVEALQSVVQEQVSAGHVVLLVTHDASLFATVQHRVWRLARGQWAA